MPKIKCVILDDYQQAALRMADWTSIAEKVDITTCHDHFGSEEELVTAIAPYEIVIIMRERTPFPASVLNRLPRLKLLITTGMRNSVIDFSAAKLHGVTVCGTRSFSEPPAELTWALLLGLARHIVQENHALQTSQHWQSTIGIDLHGKQLGILGLGKIGSQIARIGLAFGMKVTAWSQNLTRDKTDPLGISLASSKEALLENSDFVSIHLVLSDRTRGLIGREDLKRMRSSAYLINTSRAQIVDQSALIIAIKEKWIAGAGIDVFPVEPLAEQDVLRTLPNVLATPHLGYVTQRNYQAYYEDAVENIKAFLAGALIRQL